MYALSQKYMGWVRRELYTQQCACGGQRATLALVTSSRLYVGSRDLTQVDRLSHGGDLYLLGCLPSPGASVLWMWGIILVFCESLKLVLATSDLLLEGSELVQKKQTPHWEEDPHLPGQQVSWHASRAATVQSLCSQCPSGQWERGGPSQQWQRLPYSRGR